MLFTALFLCVPVLLVLAPLRYFTLRKEHLGRPVILTGSISLLCSSLSFLTVWMFVPAFILLPLSFYCAFQCYRKTVKCFRGAPVLARLCGLLPMAVALVVLQVVKEVFEAPYRA